MSTSVIDLIGRLANVKTRDDARQQLLSFGPEAAPALIDAATHGALAHHPAILEILSELRDPRADGVFREALGNADPKVRAAGARGLFLLNTPDAMDALRLTLNDDPDLLHFEQTPAVRSLIEAGMAALPTVFELMESANEATRQRAQYTLATIVLRTMTEKMKPKPLTNDALAAWTELQQLNGSYRWDAPEPSRTISVDLWKQWFRHYNSEPIVE